MLASVVSWLTKNGMVLESREAILALAPLLEALAARCGQCGAMHWLPYFLDPAVLGQRSPRLVLFLQPETSTFRELTADDLQAAALFYEYEVLGFRTGIVATGDAVGFKSVIGPEGQRATVAAAAARALIDRGASTVLATYENANEVEARAAASGWPGVRWSSQQRTVGRMLPLGTTFDDTLAALGKSTRFNLRYYRRRLEKQLPCTFIADAAPLLDQNELQILNASSLNPIHPEEFKRRIASASTLPGSFLCGLRTVDGRWLSLIGGWRQHATTVLHWQMNAAGLEKHSIGTVMRSFFLESEVARGSRSLLIFGGTPHSMRHAFVQEPVADLLFRRSGLRSFVVRHGARLLLSRRLRHKGNFVAEMLFDKELVWRKSGAVEQGTGAHLLRRARAQRVA